MLRLRPYKPRDAQAILSWSKDEEAFRRWSADRFPHFSLSCEEMNQYLFSEETSNGAWGMTAFDENGPAGYLTMRFIDPEQRVIRFGFVIVDQARRGKGFGRELIDLAIRFAFDFVRADKITLGVFENNPAAIACYLSSGFHMIPSERQEKYVFGSTSWGCLQMELEKPV